MGGPVRTPQDSIRHRVPQAGKHVRLEAYGDHPVIHLDDLPAEPGVNPFAVLPVLHMVAQDFDPLSDAIFGEFSRGQGDFSGALPILLARPSQDRLYTSLAHGARDSRDVFLILVGWRLAHPFVCLDWHAARGEFVLTSVHCYASITLQSVP